MVCLQALCSLCCMTGESWYSIYSSGFTFNVKGINWANCVVGSGFFLKHPVFPKCQDLGPAIWETDHKNHHYYITLHGTSGQTQLLMSTAHWEVSPPGKGTFVNMLLSPTKTKLPHHPHQNTLHHLNYMYFTDGITPRGAIPIK